MPNNKKPPTPDRMITRNFTIEPYVEIDDNGVARVKNVSVSSDAPVEKSMWDSLNKKTIRVNEVLDHSPEAVDLSLIQRGAVMITDDHFDGTPIGRADRPEIRGGKLYIDELYVANDIHAQRSIKGISLNRSIGARVIEAKIDRSKAPIEVRVVKWQPIHIAVVSDPADSSVGVSRSENDLLKTYGEKIMPEANQETITRNDNPAPAPALNHQPPPAQNRTGDEEAIRAAGHEAGRLDGINRIVSFENELENIFRKSKFSDEHGRQLREEAVKIRKDIIEKPNETNESAALHRAALDLLAAEPSSGIKKVDLTPGTIERSESELYDLAAQMRGGLSFREFSKREWIGKGKDDDGASGRGELGLTDIIRAGANRADKSTNAHDKNVISFLNEWEQELSKRTNPKEVDIRGKAGSISIPHEVWIRASIEAAIVNNYDPTGMIRRAATQSISGGTSGNQGGVLVDTEFAWNLYQPAIYSSAQLADMGAMTLSGLTSKVYIPMETTKFPKANSGFVSEIASVTQKGITFGGKTLEPHRQGVGVAVTRQMLIQVNMATQGILFAIMDKSRREQKDRACITGGGSNEPTGIVATSGVQSFAFDATNGAAPDFDDSIDIPTKLFSKDLMGGSPKWLLTPEFVSKLKKTAIATNDAERVIGSDNLLGGYETFLTNLLAKDGTKGSGSDLHAGIFGNFANFVIAEFGDMYMLVDPYTDHLDSQVNLYIESFTDCATLRDDSFVVFKDASVS